MGAKDKVVAAREWLVHYFETDPGASIDAAARDAHDASHPAHKSEITRIRADVRQRLNWVAPQVAVTPAPPVIRKKQEPKETEGKAMATPNVVPRQQAPVTPFRNDTLGSKLKAAGVQRPVEIEHGSTPFSNRRKVVWVDQDGNAQESVVTKDELASFVNRLVMNDAVDPADIEVFKEAFVPTWVEAKMRLQVHVEEE